MTYTDLKLNIDDLGRSAAAASRVLAVTSTEQKNAALEAAAASLLDNCSELVAANARDVSALDGKGKTAAFIDRLILTEARVSAIASAVKSIARLPDPVGRTLHESNRPNGLQIRRIATPIGVIGMIYESRPNVGADASALCLKSGNAVILRGGSESFHSTQIIVRCMQSGLSKAGLPVECIQMVGTSDRNAVVALLQCTEHLDLVIPRGGIGLVKLVRDQSKVPTLLHLEGNCHVYVHADANIESAVEIVTNAKMRRLGVCGAAESLVVDSAIAGIFLPKLIDCLGDCKLRGDERAQAIDARIDSADESDWDTEYLDAILSVKIAADADEAIAFVDAHSSKHTDAIVTENAAIAERFLNQIDSAVVMHNASTQFSDGGEFGMGAEIGIATGKIHARGPVGLEQLTSFKYQVRGDGQIRP